MRETEKNKKAVSKTDDWAVLPFDEKEDEARWTKLIEETEKLEEDTFESEAVFGAILMENILSDILRSEKPIEDELF